MQMKKIREHLSAVLKHWVALMSGAASVAIGVFEQSRGITGIPGWIFLIVSVVCFFIAFHRAWLEKDKELLDKEKHLQASLGPAPEVVLEWKCAKRNPLILHNLRGSTAYHVALVARGAAEGALLGHAHLWDLAGPGAILGAVGGGYEYLGGGPVDLGLLADGRRAPDYVLAGAPGALAALRPLLGARA